MKVGPDGYAWWYVDGISDCGTKSISIIAFIGSVFSPWYYWSGRKSPENHCCMNVVTSGLGGYFTMTDRGQGALTQSADCLTIGPSRMAWDGRRLVIDLDERGAPPRLGRVLGRVELTPEAVTAVEAGLTPDGAHLWRPFAPVARIRVSLSGEQPWAGHGYFDANFGTRALEADFDHWTWGRFPLRHSTECHYDARRRDGSRLSLAMRFDGDGTVRTVTPPPMARIRTSPWLLPLDTRSDPGQQPVLRHSLLQAPFYSRAIVEARIGGETSLGMHEALDLRRFRLPALKWMLACRVPRRARWP